MTTLYSTHLLRHLRLTIGQNIHRIRCGKKMPLGILAKLSELPREKLDYYECFKWIAGGAEDVEIVDYH